MLLFSFDVVKIGIIFELCKKISKRFGEITEKFAKENPPEGPTGEQCHA